MKHPKKKGVLTMGSRLEPTLANAFMCHFENFSLENCPVTSNELFIDGLLMIHFYYFNQRITLRNLEIFSISNIRT